jgi:hypothetical protein
VGKSTMKIKRKAALRQQDGCEGNGDINFYPGVKRKKELQNPKDRSRGH